MKNWLQFNEGKNYGDLYHGFSKKSDNENYDTLISILNDGLKFVSAGLEDGNQPMRDWYKDKSPRSANFWKNMTGDYFISTSRNPMWVKESAITFKLDGSSISDRYKIHPFDWTAVSNTKGLNMIKKNPSLYTPKEYMGLTGKRKNVYEEKIESKKPGYLSPKYIKEIILYKPSDELIKMINSIDSDIPVKVIK
jgi:hypothetical protein